MHDEADDYNSFSHSRQSVRDFGIGGLLRQECYLLGRIVVVVIVIVIIIIIIFVVVILTTATTIAITHVPYLTALRSH